MSERRPRVICPACGRDVALTEKTRVIVHHTDGSGRTTRCDGVGQKPMDADSDFHRLVRLADLVMHLEDYIERRGHERAREIVASWTMDPIRRAAPELEHHAARPDGDGRHG